MKKFNFIYALLLSSVFISCRKDHPVKVDTSGNKPVIAAVRDSVSYTIDGKTYASVPGSYSSLSSGGQEIDRKVVYPDSSNKSNYGLIGTNQDSVLYYQKNTILSDNASIAIFFIKKYIKRHKNDGLFYAPELKDLLKLFAVGKHPYAEDFEWENSQDGIAFSVSANNKGYMSYNAFNPQKSNTLKPGFQKKSTFEIINFTKATSGGYNLEARFTAVIADNTGEQKKLENGYLRLYFEPIVAAD